MPILATQPLLFNKKEQLETYRGLPKNSLHIAYQ